MVLGKPCRRTISAKKIVAMWDASAILAQGMKWATLKNGPLQLGWNRAFLAYGGDLTQNPDSRLPMGGWGRITVYITPCFAFSAWPLHRYDTA